MRRCAAVVCFSLLAGCAVGPDYHRPNVDVPAKYRYEIAEAADTANTQWWNLFEDPVLDQLIADALAGNNDVKGQIYDADGSKFGAEITIYAGPLIDQRPVVTGTANISPRRFRKKSSAPSLRHTGSMPPPTETANRAESTLGKGRT